MLLRSFLPEKRGRSSSRVRKRQIVRPLEDMASSSSQQAMQMPIESSDAGASPGGRPLPQSGGRTDPGGQSQSRMGVPLLQDLEQFPRPSKTGRTRKHRRLVGKQSVEATSYASDMKDDPSASSAGASDDAPNGGVGESRE